MKSRNDIITDLNTAEQERGNLTVLFTNSIAQNIGLSATEFECLDIIGNNQPISAGELALLCGLSTGGVTGVIDRLERAGFAKRNADPKDRRRVLLTQVTDADTIRKIIDLYQPMAKSFEATCEQFSTEELDVILRYTRNVNLNAIELLRPRSTI